MVKIKILLSQLIPFLPPRLLGWLFTFASIICPKKIRLDISTHCQLKCEHCHPPLSPKKRDTLEHGFLPLSNFAELLATNCSMRKIELSNWGEVFLHPEIKDILEAAKHHHVRVTIDNGSNFNDITPEALRAAVQTQVRSITVSIDGATQESYAQYRTGGSFKKVIDNVVELNQIKKELRSPYPKLRWQFIRFDHNTHEIDAARAMAKDLSMSFALRENHAKYPGLPFGISRLFICKQLWLSPQINWNGDILGCCINSWHKLGNIFDSNLREAFDGFNIRRMQRVALGIEKSTPDVPCHSCHLYNHDHS